MESAKKIKETTRPMPKRQRTKLSKAWLAALAHRGTGKIEDMKAVLK